MKRRETDPASNQFLKCSPPSGTHRNSQEMGYSGEKKGRVARREKERIRE